ncbi:hypothetical protein OQA88_8751 [Cercophora sp. LCS_1]
MTEETTGPDQGSVMIIILDKPDGPNRANSLLQLLNKQLLTHAPLFDSEIHDSRSITHNGTRYEVSVASASEVQYNPAIFFENDFYFSLAMTYQVESPGSFEEMITLWDSTIHAAETTQGPCDAVAALVLGLRNGRLGDQNERGRLFAEEHGYLYAECDMDTGEGVQEVFSLVAERVDTRKARHAEDSAALRRCHEQAKGFCHRSVKGCI